MKTKNIKHNSNNSLDVVIKIAKVMQPRSMVNDISGTVKEILGTYVSIGCMVDEKDTKDLQQEIIDGVLEIPQDWLLIEGIRVNYELIIPLVELSSLRRYPVYDEFLFRRTTIETPIVNSICNNGKTQILT